MPESAELAVKKNCEAEADSTVGTVRGRERPVQAFTARLDASTTDQQVTSVN